MTEELLNGIAEDPMPAPIKKASGSRSLALEQTERAGGRASPLVSISRNAKYAERVSRCITPPCASCRAPISVKGLKWVVATDVLKEQQW